MPKALFDHCVPRSLKQGLEPEIEVTTAIKENLDRVRNSELLKQAHNRGYDSLITLDGLFGGWSTFPEEYIPVVLLRGFPVADPPVLSHLIPRVKASLLRNPDPGLYIWDIYKNRYFIPDR